MGHGKSPQESYNKVGDHANARPREHLNSYGDLLAWAARLGVVDAAAARRPVAARAALKQALALREAIYRALAACYRGNSPAAGDVDIMNGALSIALGALRLRTGQASPALVWPPREALGALVHPVDVSAADLLSTPDVLARVGQCADADGCG